MKEGHIFTNDVIGQDYHNDLQKQINSLGPLDQISKIIHHISSPGGSVYGGYKGYHVLKSTGKPIKSVIEGEAQSMATFVAMAGNEIVIKNPSIWMIHNPSQGLEGDADALQGGANELRMIEDEMAQAYADWTKKPVDQIKEMMKAETRMNAKQAVDFGFANSILSDKLINAIAIGGKKMKDENVLDNLVNKFEGLLKKFSPVAEVKALDIPLQDGTVLVSSAVSEDTIMSSTVTINGQPAPDGDYTTPTGMVITVVGGVVTNVVDPTDMQQQAAQQALQAAQKQVADLQAQIAKAAQEKQQIQADAEKLKTETAVMLGDVKKEVEAIKKKTVGDASKPYEGIAPLKYPVGRAHDAKMHNQQLGKRFIYENMNWLEQYYPKDFFDDVKNSYGPMATSIIETNFNFTYPGILTTELFYKPTLSSPALSDLFTIDQGISFQKRYNVVPGLSKIIKPYTGCGAANSNGSRDLIGNVTLTTKEFRMQESWCKDDFTQQLTGIYNNLAQEWLKTGERSFDPAGTPIDAAIMQVLEDAMRRDLFIRATMAAGNSSSADFNQIDGLWDRLIDSSGAQINYCVVRAGSSLGTGTISASNATAALEAVYIGSNDLLKEQMDKATYWVTGSVYDAYVNQLVGTGNVSQAQYEALIRGTGGNTTWGGNLTYKGIPIKPVRLWDNSLADSSNPLFGTVKHLVLLTIKQNHMLGVENGADLNRIESWYEMKDSKRYYRSDFKMGYQYLHCDLQTIAY